jgi:RecB family exonuclease
MTTDLVPTQAPLPLKSWSFSSLREFERCNFTAYHRAMKSPKLVEEGKNRGTLIHEACEAYIKGQIGVLPKPLSKVERQMDEYREAYEAGTAWVEEPWAFDVAWNPVDWNAPDVWLRVQIDLRRIGAGGDNTLHIVDFKSGKSWGNELQHIQQLQLYAVTSFVKFPEVHTITATDLYIDEGKELTKIYARDEKYEKLLMKWIDRSEAMLTCTDPKPRPARHTCRFCPWGISNGSGACDYAVAY